MAAFKVGGRAECIGVPPETVSMIGRQIGVCVTVRAIEGTHLRVDWDSVPPGWEYLKCGAVEPKQWFRPLDEGHDSKADEFIAKLKKLGPLPVKEIA